MCLRIASKQNTTNNHSEKNIYVDTHTHAQCKRWRARPVDPGSLGRLLLQLGISSLWGGIHLRRIYRERSTDCFSNTSQGSPDRHPPNTQGHARYLLESQRRGGGKKGGRAERQRGGGGESEPRQRAVRLARAGTALVLGCRFPR